MNYENLKVYEGLRVLLILHNKFSYNGTVKTVDENAITILDKYNQLVSIENVQISLVIEQKNEVKK